MTTSIGKYGESLTRAFWISLALCSAAIVIGMGRNEAARYRDATDELRSIAKLSMRPYYVDKKLAELTRKQIATPIATMIAEDVTKLGISADTSRLESTMSYLLIEEGPQSFDFQASPD
jgi:hypothetical protein